MPQIAGFRGALWDASKVELAKVELEAWRNRGVGRKVLEFLASLLEEQV